MVNSIERRKRRKKYKKVESEIEYTYDNIKFCRRCKKLKKPTEFLPWRAANKEKLRTWCKKCSTEYHREWMQSHPGKNAEYLTRSREKRKKEGC
jgi:hypothetical protein